MLRFNDNFQMKKGDIFLIFAKNIDCGYKSFRAKIRKKYAYRSITIYCVLSGVQGTYPFVLRVIGCCLFVIDLIILYFSGFWGRILILTVFPWSSRIVLYL